MPKNRNGFLKKIDRYFIYLLMLLSVLMLLVCGCGNYDDEKNKDKGGDISFAPVIVPSNDEYKAMVTASTTVTIDGETYPIEYLSILKSGDRIGNEVFGQIVDQDNQALQPVHAGKAHLPLQQVTLRWCLAFSFRSTCLPCSCFTRWRLFRCSS